MQCNLGIDVVLVLDEATNFDGLEEIISRVFWDKTDTITIVQLENNCDKIRGGCFGIDHLVVMNNQSQSL